MPHRAYVLRCRPHRRSAPDDPGGCASRIAKSALAKLLPMQRHDFEGIFKAMEGLPVTIRLLDPPLHEFLPQKESEIIEVARAAGTDPAKLRARAIALHESNPMLGHRGVRLGITYPEIYEMQARAILEAALNVEAAGGKPVQLEIMVPLVGFKTELDRMKDRIDAVAAAVKAERGKLPEYLVGTMIELPRAALRAKEIAEDGGILLLRHQRPDANHHRNFARRCGHVPHRLSQQGRDRARSVCDHRRGRRRRAREDRGGTRTRRAAQSQTGQSAASMAATRIRSVLSRRGTRLRVGSPFRVPVARLAAAQAALSNITKAE